MAGAGARSCVGRLSLQPPCDPQPNDSEYLNDRTVDDGRERCDSARRDAGWQRTGETAGLAPYQRCDRIPRWRDDRDPLGRSACRDSRHRIGNRGNPARLVCAGRVPERGDKPCVVTFLRPSMA